MQSVVRWLVALVLFLSIGFEPRLGFATVDPTPYIGFMTRQGAQQLCPDCTKEQQDAILRLFNGKGVITKRANDQAATDTGFILHKTCEDAFGVGIVADTRVALTTGMLCLANQKSTASYRLIGELATVLAATKAPSPVLYCKPLGSEYLKGIGFKSPARNRAPQLILNTALSDAHSEETKSVIFHEFLHLGGSGHRHGVEQEVVTPCQFCCFDATSYANVTRDAACNLCRKTYPDKYSEGYLSDLSEWSTKTPGHEYLFRVNLLDGVKRAGGDVRFLLRVMNAYYKHPFGFQLAKKAYPLFSWPQEDERRVRLLGRKQHGHVSKRFIPLSDGIAEAFLARFALKGGYDAAMQTMMNSLIKTTLPEEELIDRLDAPIFYKYYYELSLMRGVLADEVASWLKGRYRAFCTKKKIRGNAEICENIKNSYAIFRCQRRGLDLDSKTGMCR